MPGSGRCGDVLRPSALGALLDVELDLLATGESVEVERSRQAVTMEEILLAILARDEAEASLGDDLLDGSRGHGDPPRIFSNEDLQAYGQFEKRSTTREHRHSGNARRVAPRDRPI